MGKKRIEELMDFFKINEKSAKEIDKLMTSIGSSVGRLSKKKMKEVMQEMSTYIPKMSFGIESLVNKKGREWLYINFGDTYDNTIIYSPDSRRFMIWNWGDFISQKSMQGKFN